MNDFADWLSPMVVKELRQGLRSRGFLAPFLIVQLMMIVCVLISLNSDARNTATEFFWLITGAALLVGMPIRGINSLRGEMKGQTLELLLLTQLSAWRIVAGKWAALFLQTLLLVSALSPYVVLRYFLGGVDLVGEFVILFWLLVANALLTGICVGISPFMNGFLGVVTICMTPFLGAIALRSTIGRRVVEDEVPVVITEQIWLAVACLLGPLLILSALELAVGKIAPPAEDRTLFKRLLAVAIVGVAVLLEGIHHTRGFLGAVALLMVTPILIGAITSTAPSIPVLYRRYRPFQWRQCRWELPGWLSWALGKFLRPGWATGMWFALVMIGIIAVGSGVDIGSGSLLRLIISGIGALFLPLLLVHLFFPKRNSFIVYLCFQIFFFILANMFSTSRTLREHWGSSFVPPVEFWLHFFNHFVPSKEGAGFYVLSGVTALSLLILFFLSLKEWKTIATLEREAARLG